MTNLRKAPRRKVTEVWKTGSYGKVKWHHQLSCSHVETRKRVAPAGEIGCSECQKIEAEGPKTRALAYQAPDPEILAGLSAQRLRGVIADHFGVRSEYVDVGMDYETGAPSFATVFFDQAALVSLGLWNKIN